MDEPLTPWKLIVDLVHGIGLPVGAEPFAVVHKTPSLSNSKASTDVIYRR
jgi:hypothetical protein